MTKYGSAVLLGAVCLLLGWIAAGGSRSLRRKQRPATLRKLSPSSTD